MKSDEDGARSEEDHVRFLGWAPAEAAPRARESLVYRPARPSDAEAIVVAQVEMALETEGFKLDPKDCATGVAALFADPRLGQYYIAERGAEGGPARSGSAALVAGAPALGGEAPATRAALAGVLLITYEFSEWRNGMVWWIQSVHVARSMRGQGVYRGLYDYVRSLASADEAVRGIRLYVHKENTRAQAVYTRLGMKSDHYDVFEWMKSF